MKNGDNVTCIQAQRKDAKTRAPAPFTEGTLIRAMENIHRFVTDPQHKQLLRDGDGIGTSATRAAVISDLKRRTFLEVKGKQIRSTPLGRGMIDALPEVVKSPVLTAIFERTLKGVEEGKASLDDFIQKQVAFVTNEVTKANNGAVKVGGEKTPTISVYKCKACGKGLCKRPGKTKGSFWWGCSGYPDCKQTYPDVGGKPNYVVRK